MRIATTVPAHLFNEADAAAKELGISRSRLMQTALEDFLKRRRDAQIVAGLNEAMAKYGDPSDDEQAWIEHGRQIIANMERDEE